MACGRHIASGDFEKARLRLQFLFYLKDLFIEKKKSTLFLFLRQILAHMIF